MGMDMATAMVTVMAMVKRNQEENMAAMVNMASMLNIITPSSPRKRNKIIIII